MTEAELENHIRDASARLRIYRYHAHLSVRDKAGWVDDVLIGRHGAIFAEVKSADGRRSLDQVRVARLIEGAGLTYRLYRPEDWPERIMADLRAIA